MTTRRIGSGSRSSPWPPTYSPGPRPWPSTSVSPPDDGNPNDCASGSSLSPDASSTASVEDDSDSHATGPGTGSSTPAGPRSAPPAGIPHPNDQDRRTGDDSAAGRPRQPQPTRPSYRSPHVNRPDETSRLGPWRASGLCPRGLAPPARGIGPDRLDRQQAGEEQAEQGQQHQHREADPEPVDPRGLVHVNDRLDLGLRQPGVAESGLELLVGDERDAAGQLLPTRRDRVRRDVRVVPDAREEAGRQRRDEHRTDQGGPERGAEVGGGVLQPAHLSALLVGHRRDRHRAQL